MLSPSKHEQRALCPHFPACGGCISQDMPHDAYVSSKRQIIVDALARAGVKADVAAVIETPPHSRRRAVFKIKSLPEGLHIGFHAARSHTIVDMHACDILTPALFALVGRLRTKLEPIFDVGESAELHVLECDNGFDAAFRWSRKLQPNLVTLLSQALAPTGIIRLALGSETVFEIATPHITLGPAAVKPPPLAFLQPTQAGEAALQNAVLAMTAKARTVLDLFSGLGTFSLPLAAAAKVHAVETEKTMLEALAAAAKTTPGLKPVTTEARDLFKSPLTALELNAHDAVVLDPPRAGAEAQAKTLAASKVRRIAYVSCDAASFARDAAILVKGGFTIGPVTPVDQFLFSSHIELVAEFRR